MLLVIMVWLLVVSVLVIVKLLLLMVLVFFCLVFGFFFSVCRFSWLVLGSMVLLVGLLNSGVFYLVLLWVISVYSVGGIVVWMWFSVSLVWLLGFCRLVYMVSLVSMLLLVC